jgi:hypothetical protein
MPFQEGQSGNPGGSLKKRNLLTSALDRALLAEDSKRVREIAEKIVTLAAEGDKWAVEFVWDRVEGKVPVNVKQEVDVTHRHDDVSAADRRIAEILAAGARGDATQALPH